MIVFVSYEEAWLFIHLNVSKAILWSRRSLSSDRKEMCSFEDRHWALCKSCYSCYIHTGILVQCSGHVEVLKLNTEVHHTKYHYSNQTVSKQSTF